MIISLLPKIKQKIIGILKKGTPYTATDLAFKLKSNRTTILRHLKSFTKTDICKTYTSGRKRLFIYTETPPNEKINKSYSSFSSWKETLPKTFLFLKEHARTRIYSIEGKQPDIKGFA